MTTEHEKRGLRTLAACPGNSGQWVFVGDLLTALSARGISRLWLHGDLGSCLFDGLRVIHRHASRMMTHFIEKCPDRRAEQAYRVIWQAVMPGRITDTPVAFWHHVATNYPVCRIDDCYLLCSERAFAEGILRGGLEEDYAQLLRGYALLIGRQFNNNR
jgi:hypothetical protein